MDAPLDPLGAPFYRSRMTDQTLTRSLDVPFKGSRTYLQSANGWDSIAEVLQAAPEGFASFSDPTTVLDLTFRSMIGHAVDLQLSTKRIKHPDAKAQMLVSTPSKDKCFGALIATDRPVQSKIVDVENGMKPQIHMDAEKAVFTGIPPMSLSQVYVALIKFWHQANIDADCKWLATRLQLPLACLSAKPASVTITPGTILKDGLGSVSDVSAGDDDSLSGRIWFYKT